VPVAASVLTGERYGGRPIYFSDVIVRRDSTFRSFLVTLGETHRFFGKVIEAGLHEESIRLVAAGEVDGSAIDSQVLAVAMRDDPDLPRTLRVIEALGPSTIQPVPVSKRVAPDLRIEIQNVLTSLHEDPAVRERLSVGMVDHFVPIEASSYNDIRDMLQACEAAGFMRLQ
jgi:phosphonate transport system substrate-binding protein